MRSRAKPANEPSDDQAAPIDEASDSNTLVAGPAEEKR